MQYDCNQFQGREIDISEVIEAIGDKEIVNDKQAVNGDLINPNLEGLNLETVWQDYWGKYGEYLVWEGWVTKYPDQIDFEKLHAVPATVEVEVETEETSIADVETPNATDSQEGPECLEFKNENEEYQNRFSKAKNINERTDRKCEDSSATNSLLEDKLKLSVGKSSSTDNKSPVEEAECTDKVLDISFQLKEVNCREGNKLERNIEDQSINKTEFCQKSNSESEDPMIKDNIPSLSDETTTCESDQNLADVFHNPASPLKYSSPSFKPICGDNIVNTLQNRVEGFGVETEETEEVDNQSDADNLANERTEMIQMMHCYSNFSSSQTEQMQNKVVESCENDEVSYEQVHSVEDSNNYDKMWEDLWNEHYTETYWYYYNQFAEKFNKLSPKHQVSVEQPGEVVFETEFIIIPTEHGSCSTTAEIHNENTDSEIHNSEETDDNQASLSTCNSEQIKDSENIDIVVKDISVQAGSSSPINHVSVTSNAGEKENVDMCTERSSKEKLCSTNNVILEDGDLMAGTLSKHLNESGQEDRNKHCKIIVEENCEITGKTILNTYADKENRPKFCDVSINEKSDGNVDDRDGLGEEGVAIEDNGGLEHEPEDGSRKKRKKKERQREMQAHGSTSGSLGIVLQSSCTMSNSTVNPHYNDSICSQRCCH